MSNTITKIRSNNSRLNDVKYRKVVTKEIKKIKPNYKADTENAKKKPKSESRTNIETKRDHEFIITNRIVDGIERRSAENFEDDTEAPVFLNLSKKIDYLTNPVVKYGWTRSTIYRKKTSK